jgi:hypothetical protein
MPGVFQINIRAEFVRGGFVPLAQAVSAKARQNHQFNVLDVFAII